MADLFKLNTCLNLLNCNNSNYHLTDLKFLQHKEKKNELKEVFN